MRIASFTSNIPTMGDTRTYEDFYKYLGTKPERLGVVSRLYPNLTATYLTESLKNIFYQDQKSKSKYQSIDSMRFEWEVETNYIKRVEFADVPESNGANGAEIEMAFKERYYEKYDIFKIEESGQMCQVVARPIRKADNFWVCECRYITTDIRNGIDPEDYRAGDTARFISNYMPELHEEGKIFTLLSSVMIAA
jgi:hypothetical protein